MSDITNVTDDFISIDSLGLNFDSLDMGLDQDNTVIEDIDSIGLSGTISDIDDLDSLSLNLNLDDIEQLDSVEDSSVGVKVLPFPCKFYITYLGINPLVIYKENPDVLLTVIKSQLDRIKLLELQSNMVGYQDMTSEVRVEGFVDYVNKKKIDLLSNPEIPNKDRILIDQIANTFQTNWEIYNNFINNICFKVEEFEVSPQLKSVISSATNNLSPLQVLSKQLRDIMNDLLFNPNDEFIKYIIGVYRAEKETTNTLSKIDSASNKKIVKNIFQDDAEDESDDLAKIIDTYINTDYYYTKDELKYLKLLGFPTSIAFYESYFKNDTKSSNTLIQMKASQTKKSNSQYTKLGYNTISRAISDLDTYQSLQKDKNNSPYIGLKF